MDSLYNKISNEDREQYKTYINHYVFLSGTSLPKPNDNVREENNFIQYHPHNLFYSVYNQHYSSGSANKLFDIGFFINSNWNNYESSLDINNVKSNSYIFLRQKLLDINFLTKQKENFFLHDDGVNGDRNINRGWILSFSRFLIKDNIKPGTFNCINNGGDELIDLARDYPNAITQSAISGRYSPILSNTSGHYVGLIFYDIGIIILEPDSNDDVTLLTSTGLNSGTSFSSYDDYCVSGSQDFILKSGINNFEHISFESETELQTGIFNCKIKPKDFFYSSNPTYYENGFGTKIRIKNEKRKNPVAFYTTIGLYSDQNELLAVAKTSKVLKKTSDNYQNIRVRLDF